MLFFLIHLSLLSSLLPRSICLPLSFFVIESLPSQPRFYASRFRSSFTPVFLRFFCFARLILLLPLCPVFLSCAGISCCNASPARSCNSKRKRYFYADCFSLRRASDSTATSLRRDDPRPTFHSISNLFASSSKHATIGYRL